VQTPGGKKPFAALNERLQLTVKQAANLTGKKVNLVLDDGGVELDVALWDDVAEILLHLLRNAVDHGIEMADVRDRRGKPEAGSILVSASFEHTRLVVQVIDDGRGIDPEEIRRTIVAKGFATAEQAAPLNQEQLFDYLLQPGYSTVQQASQLSGRGVGLDVVNARVTKRRGTLLIESEYRRGTCVVLCLPTQRQG
jgi:chemotaxis protein histidine kinase CheA